MVCNENNNSDGIGVHIGIEGELVEVEPVSYKEKLDPSSGNEYKTWIKIRTENNTITPIEIFDIIAKDNIGEQVWFDEIYFELKDGHESFRQTLKIQNKGGFIGYCCYGAINPS